MFLYVLPPAVTVTSLTNSSTETSSRSKMCSANCLLPRSSDGEVRREKYLLRLMRLERADHCIGLVIIDSMVFIEVRQYNRRRN